MLTSGDVADSRKARCYGQVDLRSGTEHCRDSDELSEDGTMAACCCSVGEDARLMHTPHLYNDP